MDRKKKVLIIEDDAATRTSMMNVLETEGFSVTGASDGLDGAIVLGQMEQAPGVILLDLMMPRANGWDFLDFQRNHHAYKNVPVIICSAYPGIAKSLNPAVFLQKPLHLQKLLNAVRSYCA